MKKRKVLPLKIRKIEKIGFLDTRRIIHEDYEASQKEFKLKYDIDLPNLEDTPFADSSDVRILLSDQVKLRVYTNYGVLEYTFYKGFITDLASIPAMARSLADNDADYILLGAFKHDGDFRWHFRNFVSANEEFLSICKLEGASWFQRFAIRIGIYTGIAKEAYRNREMPEEYKRIKFEWKDK